MCKHAHTRGVLRHAPPEKFFKLGALRSLLRPYLYPNATSPTRVHGGSNTAIRHDTRQLSRGVSVTIVKGGARHQFIIVNSKAHLHQLYMHSRIMCVVLARSTVVRSIHVAMILYIGILNV